MPYVIVIQKQLSKSLLPNPKRTLPPRYHLMSPFGWPPSPPCMHSVLSAIIRDDRLDLIQPVWALHVDVCVQCVQWPDQPCDQLQSTHLMQTEARFLSISSAYRWTRVRRCPWVASVNTAYYKNGSAALHLIPGYQTDSMRGKEGLTSVQYEMNWDRLALYVDRDA